MTKQIKNHPLEDMLDIERGSTPSANPFIVAEGDQHNDSDSRVLIRDEEIEVLEESDEEYINEKTIYTIVLTLKMLKNSKKSTIWDYRHFQHKCRRQP